MKGSSVEVCGRIVLLRQRLGLSQKAFGERIGRSAGYINRVENGKSDPSSDLLERISAVFGVSRLWIETGEGRFEVESIGDRFRQARKARDYTQEELAEELHISRNSVGMIERGTFRPGSDIIDALCLKLWINKNWLLTGTGSMERADMTPIYTALRVDPELRAHMKSFINHLETVSRSYRRERDEREEADRWVPAYVFNDIPAARSFLKHYNIEYREENEAGKIRIFVKAGRSVDHERVRAVKARLRRVGLAGMCDHEFVFRDRFDNTIITYSPYDVEDVRQTWIEKPGYDFYGHGSWTFVVRE